MEREVIPQNPLSSKSFEKKRIIYQIFFQDQKPYSLVKKLSINNPLGLFFLFLFYLLLLLSCLGGIFFIQEEEACVRKSSPIPSITCSSFRKNQDTLGYFPWSLCIWSMHGLKLAFYLDVAGMNSLRQRNDTAISRYSIR